MLRFAFSFFSYFEMMKADLILRTSEVFSRFQFQSLPLSIVIYKSTSTSVDPFQTVHLLLHNPQLRRTLDLDLTAVFNPEIPCSHTSQLNTTFHAFGYLHPRKVLWSLTPRLPLLTVKKSLLCD